MKELQHERGAILLSGGRGTRLREVTQNAIPKSLFEVGGKPLIDYSIESLPPNHFNPLIFAVDHHSGAIQHWVVSKDLPQDIIFSYQQTPGVLNAVMHTMDYLPEEQGNVICNTDEIRINLDMSQAIAFHRNAGTLGTLIAAYSNNLSRHGVITIRESDSRITQFRLKPEEYRRRPQETGVIFTGIMLFDTRAAEHFDASHDRNWMGMLDPLCDANQLSAYIDPRIIYFNVGTRKEYEEAEQFLANNPGQQKGC